MIWLLLARTFILSKYDLPAVIVIVFGYNNDLSDLFVTILCTIKHKHTI